VTFDMLRDRTEALIKLGGWSNVIPEPDYAFLVNEGLRMFTREAQHNVEGLSVTTVANQAEYSIVTTGDTREWIELFDDAIYNAASYLPQTTRDRLRMDDRLWRKTAAGTPRFWYWTGPSEIGLYPKPSAVVAITFEGVRHETRLDADSEAPLLCEDFHEGICLFAAWLWGKLHARGEDREIAKGYYAEALDYTVRCKDSMRSQEAGFVSRQVARPSQEYLNIGV
jgi:hypothetical protein